MNETNLSETTTETKPWYQSSTIISAIVTGGIALAAVFKLNLVDLEPQLNTALLAIGTVVGVIVTIWSRVTASKKIGS